MGENILKRRKTYVGQFLLLLLLMPASSSLQGSLLSPHGICSDRTSAMESDLLVVLAALPISGRLPLLTLSVSTSEQSSPQTCDKRTVFFGPSIPIRVLQVSSGGLSKRRSREGCAEDLFMLALYTSSPTVRVEGRILASAPDLGVRRPERSEIGCLEKQRSGRQDSLN